MEPFTEAGLITFIKLFKRASRLTLPVGSSAAFAGLTTDAVLLPLVRHAASISGGRWAGLVVAGLAAACLLFFCRPRGPDG